MFRLYETGLLNPSLWAAMWVFVAVARTGTVARPRGWTAVVASILAVGALGSFGIGLLKAYVAPRDVMQDIVSAREYRAGRSMYPARMNELIRSALEQEGGRPTGLGERVEAEAARIREIGLAEHWVQAHPPTATLLVVPAEATVGALGTQIAVEALAFVALLLAIGILIREFKPQWASREYLLIGVLVLGWGSMTTVFRNGQWDTVLLVLLTASWQSLRTGKPGRAGVFAGLAIGIKLFPAVILLVLLVRHRRAFLSAIGTFAVVLVGWAVLSPPGDFAAAGTTLTELAQEYKGYQSNLSAYGYLARVGSWGNWSTPTVAAAWWVVAGFVGAGFAGLLWRGRRQPDPAGTDWAFAAAVAIMTLASPVAWDHYLALMVLPAAILATNLQSYGGRLLLAAVVTLIAVPDATVLLVSERALGHGWEGLSVGIVEPIRTYALVLIAGTAAALGIDPRPEETPTA